MAQHFLPNGEWTKSLYPRDVSRLIIVVGVCLGNLRVSAFIGSRAATDSSRNRSLLEYRETEEKGNYMQKLSPNAPALMFSVSVMLPPTRSFIATETWLNQFHCNFTTLRMKQVAIGKNQYARHSILEEPGIPSARMHVVRLASFF